VLETSDKGCLGDAQTLRVEIDRLAIDLRFVSVGTPDDRMIINWQLEVPAATNSFDIQKREAGTAGAWQNVGTVDGNVFEFTETPLNTDVMAFEYRVSAVNKCGTQIISEVHTNILLKGIQDEDFNSLLNFSNYLGWDNGVLDYTVYGNDNRNPYSLKEAGVIPGRSVLVVNNPDQYRKCFRVRALELDGELTTSWSNEICFYYSPEVYVPNAFTANGDNLNDGFGVKGVAINEFNIQIFNRWGEKLYESDDIDEKWIPIYRDKDIQMGTYIYVIRYSDFENKVFQKTGTINLLR
jgi:gliding motility-associated-like protein